ncbi:MAG: Trk family potassium uptake protein [Oscillospiraceae bacterium]|nr:Trk family potassium uptake protein [Oscillospiraceae bacterium]
MLNIKRLSGTQIIAAGFFAIILTGGILLFLPVSNKAGASFIDTLFTAVSATCVTGLVTTDTYGTYTAFGHFIILLLIQTGGLGFISIAAVFTIGMGKKIGIRERMLMSESISLPETSGIVRLMRFIIFVTLTTELIGAVLLSICFIPEFGVADGIFKGVFHSVSAFCNAGLDLMGEKEPFSSFTGFNTFNLRCVIINLTLSILVIIGGLGFWVWEDLYCFRRRKRLRLHSKLVLIISAVLTVVGAVMFLAFEYGNPGTLGNLNLAEKIMASLSQSIFARTAGFNTVDLSSMKQETTILECLLMFIGASPGSTGGGIKTTVFAVMLLTVFSVVRGSDEVFVFGRRISKRLRLRAVAIFSMSLTVVLTGVTVICTFQGAAFEKILFEVISAFGTTGLTMGITTSMPVPAKIMLMILMYFGRVGVLTAGYAIARRQHLTQDIISYPHEDILI